MTYEVFETPQAAAKQLAAEVAELIRSRAAEGKGVVLGLATGATPLPFYAEPPPSAYSRLLETGKH